MTVVGIGNPFRGDDAAGLLAARRVRQARPQLRVFEWTAELLGLFDALAPDSALILIDAVSSGAAPGTILRWDAGLKPLPEAGQRTSTHAFSVATAIELARAVGKLPASVVLYGIEGAGFDDGAPLSGPVAAGLEELVSRIVAEVDAHA
jgi:hydrogenase maturation protease